MKEQHSLKEHLHQHRLKIKGNILLFALLLLVFVVVSSLFSFRSGLFNFLYQKPSSQAQDSTGQALAQGLEPEFISNELLIKVKNEVKDQIRQNPQDTGIASLNGLFKTHQVKNFKKVAKEMNGSIKDADIFSWYKVTLEGNGVIVKGGYDREDGALMFTQSGSQLPDQALLNLQELITSLLEDPSIETVEPNFIAKAFEEEDPCDVDPFQPGCPGYDPSARRVFVTSTTYTGDLGGVSGADAKCQQRAAGLGGTWKAWISDSVSSASARLIHHDNAYKLLDGKLIANNWDDLTDGSLQNPIDVSELGPKSVAVWTNTAKDGNIKETRARNTCEDWSSITTDGEPAYGGQGSSSMDTFIWTDAGFDYCSKPASLYCIEQSIISPSPTPSPTPVPGIPNDPYYHSTGSWGKSYPDLWGLKKINMERAWKESTGSAQIVVVDIDTGVDRNHQDLRDNMWVNDKDPIDGVDNDRNGFLDDYFGWDFANNDNDPIDDHGHGTHTVGTIAAVGNNSKGVVGVNWIVKIMAVKFLSSDGSGAYENGAKSIQYAADMGIKISSNSWGGPYSSIANDAVKYAHDKGMTVVVSAGNSNIDALDFSPASSDYAITVAASDPDDKKASFSNWGEKIDVSAPGVDILSTRSSQDQICGLSTIGNFYCRLNGTSMSAPHVAGLAALLLSKNPSLTNEDIRQIIRTAAIDLVPAGKDKDSGYGRIDAANSLLTTKPLNVIITNPGSRIKMDRTALPIIGSAYGLKFANYKVEVGNGRNPTDWVLINSSTTPVMSGVLANFDPIIMNDGKNIIRLTATDIEGKSYQFQVYDIETDNIESVIHSPTGFLYKGNLDITGSAYPKFGDPFGNYRLEWGEGENPTSWLTDGITLINSGTQPVTDGKLASWDTTTFSNNQKITLRLTVSLATGQYDQFSKTVTFDEDLVSGWPKSIEPKYPQFNEVMPAIADLNGDGTKEIIALSPAGKIHVWSKDGSDFTGFPVSVDSGYYFNSPVSVADINNDGKMEIITSATNYSNLRKIYILKDNGQFYPGWPKPSLYKTINSDGTPAIGDLDGDGIKELVILEDLPLSVWKIHAYHLDGSEVAGFPKTILNHLSPSTFYAGPSLADIDGDGKMEIAVGNNDKAYLFDYKGDILPGWPYTTSPKLGKKMLFKSPFSFGDIDGDGYMEIFSIASSENCGEIGSIAPSLYGFKKDGSSFIEWPQDLQEKMPYCDFPIHAASVVDIDGDGKDEVAVVMQGLRLYNQAGLRFKQTADFPPRITTSISDVNGDGKFEFSSVGGNNEIVSIILNTGEDYWARRILLFDDFRSFRHPPALADIDNNGKIDMVISRTPYFFMVPTVDIYLWELPLSGSNPAKYEWPMFSHDAARTGRLVTRESVNYNLASGWNSLGIPLNVTINPSELLSKTENKCTSLIGVNPVSQKLSSYPNNGATEETLTSIDNGYGYLIYCNDNASFTLSGSDLTDYVKMNPGNQIITVPQSKNNILAEDFLQEIVIKEPTLSCPAVAKYDKSTSTWNPVHIIGTTENNFNINSNEGYLVYCQNK